MSTGRQFCDTTLFISLQRSSLHSISFVTPQSTSFVLQPWASRCLTHCTLVNVTPNVLSATNRNYLLKITAMGDNATSNTVAGEVSHWCLGRYTLPQHGLLDTMLSSAHLTTYHALKKKKAWGPKNPPRFNQFDAVFYHTCCISEFATF